MNQVSFKDNLRDELLNAEIFFSLNEGRDMGWMISRASCDSVTIS